MRRPEFIARQSAHPSGVLGRVIGRIMARQTATANRRALDLLGIDDHSRILEVGFGHGRTLARAAELAPRGFVAGIGVSSAMHDMARKLNRELIAKGRMEIRQASSDQISFPDQSFDRIYVVHTLYFWRDPLAHLREIHRVCRAGGRFALGFSSKEDTRRTAAFPESVYTIYSVDETQGLLVKAGFRGIRMFREQAESREIAFASSDR